MESINRTFNLWIINKLKKLANCKHFAFISFFINWKRLHRNYDCNYNLLRDFLENANHFSFLQQLLLDENYDVVKIWEPMLEFYVNVKFTKMDDLVKTEFKVGKWTWWWKNALFLLQWSGISCTHYAWFFF